MRWDIIHLVILAYTIFLVVRADYLGLGYVRGTRLLLPRTTILRLHYGVLVGVVGMIVSGIFLFIPLREYLMTQPAFYLKMFFVFVLVLNAGVIGAVSHIASVRPFSELQNRERNILFISGASSLCAWAGAIIIGFFFL